MPRSRVMPTSVRSSSFDEKLPEGQHDLGIDQRSWAPQVVPARIDLVLAGVTVARWPALHDVGDVDRRIGAKPISPSS